MVATDNTTTSSFPSFHLSIRSKNSFSTSPQQQYYQTVFIVLKHLVSSQLSNIQCVLWTRNVTKKKLKRTQRCNFCFRLVYRKWIVNHKARQFKAAHALIQFIYTIYIFNFGFGGNAVTLAATNDYIDVHIQNIRKLYASYSSLWLFTQNWCFFMYISFQNISYLRWMTSL